MTLPTTITVAGKVLHRAMGELITVLPVSGQCGAVAHSVAVACSGFSDCMCVCTCLCIPQYNLRYQMTAAHPLALK